MKISVEEKCEMVTAQSIREPKVIYSAYTLRRNMRPNTFAPDTIEKMLEEKKVMSIQQIIKRAGCSPRTFYRLLQNIDHYSSYNQLRKYVTLKETPQFDKLGLWENNGIFFSKWGGVQPTIKHIVEHSKMGLSAGQINNALKIRVNNQIRELVKQMEIAKKKFGQFQIYFSADPETKEQQIQQRKQAEEVKLEGTPATRAQLIKILLTLIAHYKITAEALYTLLQEKGQKVPKRAIKWVFDKFQIEKKGSL
jgi:hypothetical protein